MFFDTNSHYSGNYRCYIPPTPFKGGENPCKSPNFVQKINALKFANIELNSPAFKGGENPCKSLNSLQKINALKFANIELNSPALQSPIAIGRELVSKKN